MPPLSVSSRQNAFDGSERPAARPVIDPQLIALLVKQGDEFIAVGDIASARLVLQRAAEAGNARAAFLLGNTFDPLTLRKLGALDFLADPAKARRWYEQAKEFGSVSAEERLRILTSENR
jgi:TPR repeat protein